jgi:hypothetical protein
LGTTLTGDPTLATDGQRVWAFARGTDNGLWYRQWNGSTWSAWTTLGQSVFGDPTVTWDGVALWAFELGGDNGLWYRRLDPVTGWSAWTKERSNFAGNTGAVSGP